MPKWRRFEGLVAKIQKDLTSNAVVTCADRIPGTSGVPREVDISVRVKVGQFDLLIAIECKDHSEPVDIKGVEEFVGMVQDIRASKAAIVSASGFTNAAKIRAAQAGVGLYRIVDAGEHDWHSDIAVPALWDFRYLRDIRVRLSTQVGLVTTDGSLLNAPLFDGEGKLLGEAPNAVRLLWNRGVLPYKPGRTNDIKILRGELRAEVGAVKLNVNLSADLFVSRTVRFGYVPLAKISGFQDQASGEIVTREFETTDIDVREVEKTWQVVKRLTDLAPRPMFREVALKNIGEDIYTGVGIQIYFH